MTASGPQLSLFAPAAAVTTPARDAESAPTSTTRCSSKRARARARPRRSSIASSRSCARASRCAPIAAITFTEKAAAELRYRVRAELERHAAVDAACAAALDELDAAAICTLHAFAQRLLTEFPIEAGLPPRIEVRDEIASAVAFDARWERFVDQLLDEPAYQPRRRARPRGRREVRAAARGRRGVRRQLGPARPGPAAARAPRGRLDDWIAELEAALRGARPLHRRRRQAGRAARRARGLRGRAARRARHGRPHRAAAARAAVVQGRQRIGRKSIWRCDLEDAARAHPSQLGRRAGRRCSSGVATRSSATSRSRSPSSPTTTSPNAARAGELEFHDLLVLAAAAAARPAARPGRAARGSARALPAPARSTSSRTPTRSRSTSRCCSPPVDRRRRRRGRGAKSTIEPGPAVLRRRPEAVDLPVPAGRHRDVPARRATRSPTRRCCSRATSARPARCSRGSTTCSAS